MTTDLYETLSAVRAHTGTNRVAALTLPPPQALRCSPSSPAGSAH